ncbi:Asp/Glu/hydantoin racemase [Enterococcus sp. JM4C]|nr:Asp/Glu/hydantoin racemase [Enterococcus sp. JM4C]
MKIGLVYTGVTPQLIDIVESELDKELGDKVKYISYKDPTIIAEARENGYVTKAAATRLFSLYLKAIEEGVDAILNICSSVGEAVDSVQDMSKYLGVPIVRIDEEMCRDAARKSNRIGVIATLATTMEPTKQTILRTAREIGQHPQLVDGLIEGAFDLDEEEFKQVMLSKAEELKNQVDLFVFCQGSMAYCDSYIQEKTGIETLSSPKYGARALKQALINTGKLEG